MAGKGGGAWKVAYADFVTAMMAFFMVMWICSQDQKIRDEVAHYFSSPSFFFKDPVGQGKKPDVTGAVMENPVAGTVPQAKSVAMGKGRQSHTAAGPDGRATKLLSDWIHSKPGSEKYWREQAAKARARAALTKGPDAKSGEQEDAAAHQLAKQMRDEFTKGMPVQEGSPYGDLLYEILAEVHWTELAQDMLWGEPRAKAGTVIE